jgi:hypothetical protein
MNILVLGCDGNAGLNYARSLAMTGYDIRLYGTGLNQYQLASAQLSGLYDEVWNLSDLDYEQKTDTIYQIVYDYEIDFVHAQPEEEVEFLCRNPDLPSFGKNLVEQQFYRDKNTVQQYLGNDVVTLDELTWGHCLKWKGFWVRANNGAGSKYAMPCHSIAHAKMWADFLMASRKITSYTELTCSQYLPGEEYAVQMFVVDGDIKHILQRQRVEHFFAKQMLSGQSSTPSVAKSTNHKDVNDIARETIGACSAFLNVVPNGIYGVDMRRDADGVPVVTEVNYGRYFTTSNFFATLGYNTPAAEAKYVKFGGEVEKILETEEDYYWIRALDSKPTLIHKEGVHDLHKYDNR